MPANSQIRKFNPPMPTIIFWKVSGSALENWGKGNGRCTLILIPGLEPGIFLFVSYPWKTFTAQNLRLFVDEIGMSKLPPKVDTPQSKGQNSKFILGFLKIEFLLSGHLKNQRPSDLHPAD